ncbi:MAG: carbon starvation protein CstA [Bacteroidetes bacterium GWF2_38_335]|nr:MAG: carbon starvation protein CstA [Bacteroidetes bacterium GWF2_38_335]HBS88036.1 carbon starvation protein A [Bacteroidales bacterium]
MITFLISLAILVGGYFVYGAILERVFGTDPSRETPVKRLKDGVDYVELPLWRIFLIQFLNIAGLGPIFGAVAGAMWGPVAFLWIVFGCIFGGMVHDYIAGMLSMRHDGKSIPEIVGQYLGVGTKQFMRGFTVLLMIVVGAVFVKGPAGILNSISNDEMGITFWMAAVFIYYILATMLPIDKLIGNVYPIFGFALLFMAVGILGGIFAGGFTLPEFSMSSFTNSHNNPDSFPIFPMMFVSIACGAISGFHSTQSPLMARCIKNEKHGKRIFAGAMVAEGIVALIWAAAAMAFFGGTEELNSAMAVHKNDAAWAVNHISNTLLGSAGAVLALLGVVAAPITSGDTAFRSARLIVADFLNYNQKPIKNRLLVTIPLFVVGFILVQLDFGIIWRYMSWANQSLAMIVLWTITVYLAMEKKFYWITLVPAILMTAVCISYLLTAPEGFSISSYIGNAIGVGVAVLLVLVFMVWKYRKMEIR